MDSLNIHSIIDGCRANNETARELLFQQVFEFSLPIARRYARTDTEAIRQVEDLYVEILELLPVYDPHQINFKSWAKQLLLPKCIDQVKARLNARQDHEKGFTQDWYYLYRVRQLSPLQQALLNLHDLEGYSIKEIAGIFSIETAACDRQYQEAAALISAPVSGLATPLAPLPFAKDHKLAAEAWNRLGVIVSERFPAEHLEKQQVETAAGEVLLERSWLGWAVLIGLLSGCLILLHSLHLVSPMRGKVQTAPVNHFLLPAKK